jgi:NAD(P)-dependent dehydrogenase (short-subunit alcohol dehydrogenase family)
LAPPHGAVEAFEECRARQRHRFRPLDAPREDVLPRSDRLRVIALDVTDSQSIRHAVDSAGPIHVLVNNAGIGFLNALEGTPLDIAREVFETETLGTIAMTQAVVPQFRERRSGVTST